MSDTTSKPRIKVVRSRQLSRGADKRYIIVNPDTGEILDDAQGYGYKSPQKAHAAWAYKTRSPAKKKRDNNTRRQVKKWIRENPELVETLEADALEILTGGYGPDCVFDEEWVDQVLAHANQTNLPFTAKDLLKYW